MRKAPRRLRAAASFLAAVAVLLATTARPAHGIFGIGDIVYDPANHGNAVLRYAQLILQARHLYDQVRLTTQQVNHTYQQARGFSAGRLRLPSINDVLDRMEGRFGEGESVGYGNSRLDEVFRRTFPRLSDWNHRAAGQQADAARQAAYGVLMGTRDHYLQMARSRARLEELKGQAAGAATDREVAQVQNRIAAEQLDQQILDRNLGVGAANLQAVDMALRADQAARSAAEDTAGAIYRAHQQELHESLAGRVRARQDSIARARRAREQSRHR